ncbi:hypothetical protein GCM10023314_15710 [Algibacter agarivorans]|uniref:Glycosyltransferase 2-like domain-containing protein n=1 Tax=Algibacter agarivorans TaxID=1109741 RepID=A0ABP9GH47_9FLAO
MQNECIIIIPCFNEEKRLDINAYQSFLNLTKSFSICFINDGSTDNTIDLLTQIKKNSPNTILIDLKKNLGKAEAIRHAVLHIEGDYKHIGYLDADLSTPLQEFERLFKNKRPHADFVFGSRMKKLGTSIKRSFARHISGRIIATITDVYILKLPIYDTQCGAKLMTTHLAKQLFKRPFVGNWLFDIELFLRAQKIINPKTFITEVEEFQLIEWYDRGGSKIKLIDIIKLPLELYKIRKHYKS